VTALLLQRLQPISQQLLPRQSSALLLLLRLHQLHQLHRGRHLLLHLATSPPPLVRQKRRLLRGRPVRVPATIRSPAVTLAQRARQLHVLATIRLLAATAARCLDQLPGQVVLARQAVPDRIPA
jgi:hypothetical protein